VVSIAEYKKEFAKDYGINREDFEFKKKKEYEKNLESLCIVIYVVEEKKEEINKKMKEMHEDSDNVYKFYSYLTDTAQSRYDSLVLNRLFNVPMKYEVLKGVYIRQNIIVEQEKCRLHQAILNVYQNDIKLFECVEQGYGKRNDEVFVYYYKENMQLVQKYFREQFHTHIRLEDREEITTSVRHLNIAQVEHTRQFNERLEMKIKEKRNKINQVKWKPKVKFAPIKEMYKEQKTIRTYQKCQNLKKKVIVIVMKKVIVRQKVKITL